MDDVKKTVDDALAQEMSRREFLAKAGAAALTVVGVTAVLKSLAGSQKSQSNGYGSSSYGGKKH